MCVAGRAPDTHSRLLRCSHDPAGGEGWILATEKEAEISWGWGQRVWETFAFLKGSDMTGCLRLSSWGQDLSLRLCLCRFTEEASGDR